MFKRGNIWYIRNARGKKVSTGTSDEAEAREIESEQSQEKRHRARFPQLWRDLDSKPKHTLGEACEKWAFEHQHQAGLKATLIFFKFWVDKYGPDCLLSQINRNNCHNHIKYRVTEHASPQNHTANNYTSSLKKVLRCAAEVWHCPEDPWYEGTLPALRVDYPTPGKRSRVLTVAEWVALDGCLGGDLGNMARFSLATLLRESNVFSLTPNHVKQGAAYFGADEMKMREPHSVPLNLTAQAVLERCGKDKIGMAPLFLFHGKPLQHLRGSAYVAWQRAVNRSGIDPCTFHDLRRTGASWLAMAGVPEEVRMRLGAWQRKGAMQQHYTHFEVESLRPWIAKIDEVLAGNVVPLLPQSALTA